VQATEHGSDVGGGWSVGHVAIRKNESQKSIILLGSYVRSSKVVARNHLKKIRLLSATNLVVKVTYYYVFMLYYKSENTLQAVLKRKNLVMYSHCKFQNRYRDGTKIYSLKILSDFSRKMAALPLSISHLSNLILLFQ